jgi:protein LTV1
MLAQPTHQRAGVVIDSSSSIKPIVLSRKTSLPIGYEPNRRMETMNEASSTEDDEEEENDTELTETSRPKKPITRPRNETAEEKKLRKQLAKEEQRSRRQMKREVKSIYKNEVSKQVQSYAKQQDINQAHVFKTAS